MQNRTPNRLPNLYKHNNNKNVGNFEYSDTINSNSGNIMIEKDELELIRNQIKDVVNTNKE